MPVLISFRTLKLCDWTGWLLRFEKLFTWVKSKACLLREDVSRHITLATPPWCTGKVIHVHKQLVSGKAKP